MNAEPVKKKRGRPLKNPNLDEPDATRRNREAQTRYRQRVGIQVGAVVDDLDNCDEERKDLKSRVATLTKLLMDCETQVSGIMTSMKASPPKTKAKQLPAPAPMAMDGVKGKEASKMIQGAIRGKIARTKMKQAEKDMNFDILTRERSFKK